MKVEVSDIFVMVHWGGTLVKLQMETQPQAEALGRHLEAHKDLLPYTEWDNFHSQGQEPGFLATLGRVYYMFLDPAWGNKSSNPL